MKSVCDVEGLMDLAWAYRGSRVLFIAMRLDVFTLLNGEVMSAEGVASAAGSDPDMTERLLFACCALGLLSCRDGVYENSGLATKYLVKGRPHFLGAWIDHANRDLWDVWTSGIDGEVGGPAAEGGDWHTRFINAMHALAMSGEAEELAKTLDLKGRKRLLDVGGGPGTYSIFLCKVNPELKAVVFDLPETIKMTDMRISEFGMSGRMSTRGGSWDDTDFGSGYDVVLFSNVLHGRGSKAEMKLEKAFASMNSGWLLVIRDFILADSGDGPISAAFFNLMLGAYSENELKDLIKAAGFQKPRVLETNFGNSTVLVADRP
jgi:Dimerisation domain/O-methyltransferase domain